MNIDTTNETDVLTTRPGSALNQLTWTPIVGRVSGLPTETLDFVSTVTRDLLTDRRACVQRSVELAPLLEKTLFELIQSSSVDQDMRRGLLSVKRALHKNRSLPWSESLRDQALALLSEDDALSFLEFIGLDRKISGFDSAIAVAVEGDREKLLKCLSDVFAAFPEYFDSLLIAAPDWVAFAKPHLGLATSPKDIKTALLYAARASIKTSPFSGLTTVGVPNDQSAGRGRTRLGVATGQELLRLLTRDATTAALFKYRVGVSKPGKAANEPLFLHSEIVSLDGIGWRDDRVFQANNVANWIELLHIDDSAELSHAEVLSRIGGKDPFTRYIRLLDAGILYVIPPWGEGEDPIDCLASLVGDRSPVSRDELREVQNLAHNLHSRHGESRLADLAQVKRLVDGWSSKPTAGSKKPSGLIYEDRETELSLANPFDDPLVINDMGRIREQVRPSVVRSHIYDFLVDSFVAEFGTGGICRDPLAFFMRLMVDRDTNPPFLKAQTADMSMRSSASTERAFLPVGPTSAPPSVGIHFQVAANSMKEISSGNYKIVINQFGAGTGALLARFTSLLGDGFKSELSSYVKKIWGTAEVRQLVVWGDSNTAQAESAGVLPSLQIPGELNSPGSLSIGETVLMHDSSTDTLSLCDKSGAPFGLAYLGLTPQHLMQGYTRLLAVLADPWVNVSESSDYTMTKLYEFQRFYSSEPLHLPRIEDDRIVTRRASWICPITSVPKRSKGQTDLEFILRLDEFRNKYGIPEEVFVHQLSAPGLPLLASKKPIWASLALLNSVDVFWRWLHPKTTHIRIVEALPERHNYPQRDLSGRRRATEYTSMWNWSRPGAERS